MKRWQTRRHRAIISWPIVSLLSSRFPISAAFLFFTDDRSIAWLLEPADFVGEVRVGTVARSVPMPASPARSPEIKSGERLAFLSANARPFRFAHNRGRRPAETTGVALPWRWAIAYLHRTFHSHDANCFFDTISKLNYPPAMPEHLSHVMRKNAGLLAKGEGEDHRWRGGGARHRGMACSHRLGVAFRRIK